MCGTLSVIFDKINQTPSPKDGVAALQPQSTNPKIETQLETIQRHYNTASHISAL